MRIVFLALKDLLQIVRDWKAAFFLLVLPIAFTLLFGFAFSGSDDGSSDPRIPIGYIDQDEGMLSPYLGDALDLSEVILIDDTTDNLPELEERVADEELAAVVVVPGSFSERLIAGDPIPLEVIVDKGSATGLAIDNEISSIITRLATAVQTAIFSTAAYKHQTGADPVDADSYFNTALNNALDAWRDPPITIAPSDSSIVVSEELETEAAIDENPYAHSSPGMMAQFAIAGLMGASAIIVIEKKSGALSRLVTTPTSKFQILTGHFLAMLVMIFVQLFLLMLFGQIFLDLQYSVKPLASLFVALSAAFFTASLGLLIGALAKTEDQVVILSLIPMFILAGFGGAWVPLEITPETFQKFARLTPLAWVMDGFQDIIIRGQGLETVWVAGAVLLGYSVILLAIALWQFRFEKA